MPREIKPQFLPGALGHGGRGGTPVERVPTDVFAPLHVAGTRSTASRFPPNTIRDAEDVALTKRGRQGRVVSVAALIRRKSKRLLE